jgi:hypothetical protein
MRSQSMRKREHEFQLEYLTVSHFRLLLRISKYSGQVKFCCSASETVFELCLMFKTARRHIRDRGARRTS